jgi:hypothetical protein
MSQNTNHNGFDKNSIFSVLYRNRVVISKGTVTVVNLSILFTMISFLCAPWLVIIGAIVALVMGYRFSFEKNSPDFGGSIDDIVQNAAGKVKGVVDSFTKDKDEPQEGEAWNGEEDVH